MTKLTKKLITKLMINDFKKNKYVDYDMTYFTNRIINNEYFSYSRFNDGELICGIKQIDKHINKSVKNCDNHDYFSKMGDELNITLNNSDGVRYFIQYLDEWIDSEVFKGYTETLLNKNLINGVYQKTDFLQYSLRNNPTDFKKFVSTLNEHKIILVGPKYLSNINFLKVDNFIEVPTLNCYSKKDEILSKIKEVLTKNTIILFSSSMATNVFIDDLFVEYGNNNFLIDIGSLWDIFFYKSNPEIIQRSPNLNKLVTFQNWYLNYFQ